MRKSANYFRTQKVANALSYCSMLIKKYQIHFDKLAMIKLAFYLFVYVHAYIKSSYMQQKLN